MSTSLTKRLAINTAGLAALGVLLLVPSAAIGSLGLVASNQPKPPVAPGLIAGLLSHLPPPPIPLPPAVEHNPLFVAQPTPLPTSVMPVAITAGRVQGLDVADTLSPGTSTPSTVVVTNTGTAPITSLVISVSGTPGVLAPWVTLSLASASGSTTLPLTSALQGASLAVPVKLTPGASTTLTLTVSLAQATPTSAEAATQGFSLTMSALAGETRGLA